MENAIRRSSFERTSIEKLEAKVAVVVPLYISVSSPTHFRLGIVVHLQQQQQQKKKK